MSALNKEDVAKTVIKAVGDMVDAQLEQLDNLDHSDLERIRKERLEAMKKESEDRKNWLLNGHGEYAEIDEPVFFTATKNSDRLIVHFYTSDSPRGKIFDHHLKLLAGKHIETRMVKINMEKAPFLTKRLGVKVSPSLLIIINSKVKEIIKGFSQLGDCDDFSTELLEWRLGASGVINYDGDLTELPKKTKINQKVKTVPKKKGGIRSSNCSNSDSDND